MHFFSQCLLHFSEIKLLFIFPHQKDVRTTNPIVWLPTTQWGLLSPVHKMYLTVNKESEVAPVLVIHNTLKGNFLKRKFLWDSNGSEKCGHQPLFSLLLKNTVYRKHEDHNEGFIHWISAWDWEKDCFFIVSLWGSFSFMMCLLPWTAYENVKGSWTWVVPLT